MQTLQEPRLGSTNHKADDDDEDANDDEDDEDDEGEPEALEPDTYEASGILLRRDFKTTQDLAFELKGMSLASESAGKPNTKKHTNQ